MSLWGVGASSRFIRASEDVHTVTNLIAASIWHNTVKILEPIRAVFAMRFSSHPPLSFATIFRSEGQSPRRPGPACLPLSLQRVTSDLRIVIRC